MTQIMGPILAQILKQGVESKKHLHATLEGALGGVVAQDEFNEWLQLAGFADLFSTKAKISISTNGGPFIPPQGIPQMGQAPGVPGFMKIDQGQDDLPKDDDTDELDGGVAQLSTVNPDERFGVVGESSASLERTPLSIPSFSPVGNGGQ